MINNGDPENHLDIVQLLIDHGVDLNAIDDTFEGNTPLLSGIPFNQFFIIFNFYNILNLSMCSFFFKIN